MDGKYTSILKTTFNSANVQHIYVFYSNIQKKNRKVEFFKEDSFGYYNFHIGNSLKNKRVL